MGKGRQAVPITIRVNDKNKKPLENEQRTNYTLPNHATNR